MRSTFVGAALGVALLLAACGGGTQTPGAGGGGSPAPEVPSGDIQYFGTEFAFSGPETIGAGRTTFTLTNRGEQPHMLIMVELLQGKTIEDVNKFIKEQGVEGRPPKWAKEIRMEAFAKPGKTDTAKPVELTPGTYAMLCFVTDKETKKSHAELGMTMELTVE